MVLQYGHLHTSYMYLLLRTVHINTGSTLYAYTYTAAYNITTTAYSQLYMLVKKVFVLYTT